jgi:hypothetical protein
VIHILEAQVHLLAVAIPRFILIEEPLLFLHTMAQSWCGVAQSMEPQTALVSGKDGLDDIRIIIKQAPQHLTNNGFLLLEHGYNQQRGMRTCH